MENNKNVRFIRVRGRVIPIRQKEVSTKQTVGKSLKVAGGTSYVAGLYGLLKTPGLKNLSRPFHRRAYAGLEKMRDLPFPSRKFSQVRAISTANAKIGGGILKAGKFAKANWFGLAIGGLVTHSIGQKLSRKRK